MTLECCDSSAKPIACIRIPSIFACAKYFAEEGGCGGTGSNVKEKICYEEIENVDYEYITRTLC